MSLPAYCGHNLEVSVRMDFMLAEAFPWVDRVAQYKLIDCWLEANPERKPKRVNRFLVNWFQKQPLPNGKPQIGVGPCGTVNPKYLEYQRLKAAGKVKCSWEEWRTGPTASTRPASTR